MADTISTVLETRATYEDAGLERGLGRIADLADRASAKLIGGLRNAALAAGDEIAVMGRAASSFRGSFPTDQLSAFASELQGLTSVADDQTASMLGLLGSYGATADQARRLALPILNTAEALKEAGVTTESLSRQIGQALSSGNLGQMDRSLGVDEAAFKIDRFGAILDALKRRGGSAAEEFRETLPGALEASKNAFGDLQEALGAPLVGPLTTLAHLAENAANFFTNLPGPVKTTATVLGVGLAGALGILNLGLKAATAQTMLLLNAQLRGTGVAVNYGAAQAGAGMAAGGRGLLGRVGGVGGLLRGGGVAAAGMLAGGAIGGTGGAVVQGMGIGAGIGMMFGPIGAAVGAAVGGLAGGLYDMQNRASERATQREMGGTKVNPELEELQRQNAQLQEMVRLLRGFSSPGDLYGVAGPVPDREMARALRRQVGW